MWARFQRIEDRFVNPGRVALYAAVLLFCYAVFMATGHFHHLWLVDEDGRGRATDFVAAWAATQLASAGQAAMAYDLAAFTREQLTAVASIGGNYPWAYPPTYFLVIAALAPFSYAVGAVIWILCTMALYVGAVYLIVPRRSAIFAALASPFALWSFYSGQNGFFTAALIGGVLALLDSAPVAAGILLGLLTVKPQLGIVFPIILVATGRWRVFAAAAVTAIVLAGVSYALYGVETWRAFLDALPQQAGAVLDRGEVAFRKQQSVHALVRALGGADALAWAAHGLVAAVAVAFNIWLWRKPVDDRLKKASLAIAALLATPYLFIYDLPILTVPVAFLASYGIDHGFFPAERTILVLLMLLLLLAAGLPVGMPLLLALWLVTVLRLRQVPAPGPA